MTHEFQRSVVTSRPSRIHRLPPEKSLAPMTAFMSAANLAEREARILAHAQRVDREEPASQKPSPNRGRCGRGRPRPWSAAELAIFRELDDRGASNTEIADRLQRSLQSVRSKRASRRICGC